MAEGMIQVPLDGVGKQLRTAENAGRHQQVVTPAKANGTFIEPLTNVELRASPVPVSGTVTATGPVTDAQLRATPLPVLDKTSPMPLAYDYMSLTYTGDDLTGIAYKVGGAGGATVATVTMTYSAGKLQTWTRT